MSTVLGTALPVFALILLGYVGARRHWLGPAASATLNRFVGSMALPALLFLAMARIAWEDLRETGYVAAFGLATLLTFAISLWLVRDRALAVADRAVHGLSASYANAGFMGIPLCLAVLGPDSLAPAVLATLMTAGAQFALVTGWVELATQREAGSAWRAVAGTLRAMARNPLLVAPVAGLAWSASGVALPMALERTADLLAAAASPSALVAIGLFLAQAAPSGDDRMVWQGTFLKLVVHPALAAILAYGVFDMPPVWAATVVLMSALPTGTGPFLLAGLHARPANTASRIILVTTVASVVSVSLLTWFYT